MYIWGLIHKKQAISINLGCKVESSKTLQHIGQIAIFKAFLKIANEYTYLQNLLKSQWTQNFAYAKGPGRPVYLAGETLENSNVP
jgi:hypothetical protein